MRDSRPSDQDIQRELLALRDRHRSVLMATVSADGEPEASYAPYVLDPDGCFYVYLSGLARHGRNLLAQPRASLLFVEPEEEAPQIFARRRLSYVCRAELVERDTPQWRAVLERFEQRFGAVMGVLRGLADFRLFRLEPQRGSYVRGFGQAYELEGPGLARLKAVTAERLGRQAE